MWYHIDNSERDFPCEGESENLYSDGEVKYSQSRQAKVYRD